MTTLDDVFELGQREHFLAVVSTVRADLSVQSSLVNAGILAHPESGARCVAFVTYGPTKLSNLRARPQLAVTFRSGWQWATVEGIATLIGPDDPSPSLSADRLPTLLRDVFKSAGGTHDDWNAYDATMREQRRVAVFVTPTRIYSNRAT